MEPDWAEKYINEFFKGVYTSELEYKQKLDATDSLLVGILVVLAGVGTYYARLWPTSNPDGLVDWAFILLVVIYAAAFILATWSLVASLWPREIGFISSPKEFDEYLVQLNAYYDANPDVAPPRRTEAIAADLANLLRQQHTEASELNRTNVVLKAGNQTRAKWCLVIAAVAILLNAIPTFCEQNGKIETQKVEIIKPIPKG